MRRIRRDDRARKGAKKAAKAGTATAKKPAKAEATKTAKKPAKTEAAKPTKTDSAKATKKPAPPAAVASFVAPDERLTKLDRKRLAARLAKEEDEYAQLQLLEEAAQPLLADDSDARRVAYALLWELWANGSFAHATLDPAVKKALLANLAEGVEHEYATLAARDVLHLFLVRRRARTTGRDIASSPTRIIAGSPAAR